MSDPNPAIVNHIETPHHYATDCPPCHQWFEEMTALRERYAPLVEAAQHAVDSIGWIDKGDCMYDVWAALADLGEGQ